MNIIITVKYYLPLPDFIRVELVTNPFIMRLFNTRPT